MSGLLALDHRKRNAVHEQHQVRPAKLVAPRPLDLKLLRDMEHVVRQVPPIYVLQREALRVPVNRLFQRLAQRQQVINLLAGPHQPVERDVLERLHRRLDVALP